MVDAVSILLVAAGALLAVWWAVANRPHRAAGFIASSIVILAGAVLLLTSRIAELSIEHVGTIEAAAARASADAAVIQDVRASIEAQAATVDGVAATAAESKRVAAKTSAELAKAESRLAALNKLIERGDESLRKVELGLFAAESRAAPVEQPVAVRDLSADQVEVLAASLRTSGAQELTLTATMNDSEAIEFADTLKKAIEAGGWTVHGVHQATWTQPTFGLQILAPHPLPAHATTLLSALGRAGLQPRGLSRQQVEQLEVRVGSKPR
jgi:hypothetical protein